MEEKASCKNVKNKLKSIQLLYSDKKQMNKRIKKVQEKTFATVKEHSVTNSGKSSQERKVQVNQGHNR
ncbi:MAG: hypothetical protein IC227_07505 [Enterococcus lacertideformus]|uniref:Uncharacterized protein n=1 Tax=Enterococcus lacertideformus TaxID=2771493 RepID=A0A931AW45_9ENTE|nr:hypothetical protein [Enterococcus lacertideformus]